jgi:hypothetical protein
MPFFYQPVLDQQPGKLDLPTMQPHVGSHDQVFDACTGTRVYPERRHPFRSAFQAVPDYHPSDPPRETAPVLYDNTLGWWHSDDRLERDKRGDDFITLDNPGKCYYYDVIPPPCRVAVTKPVYFEKAKCFDPKTNRNIGARAIDSGLLRPMLIGKPQAPLR